MAAGPHELDPDGGGRRAQHGGGTGGGVAGDIDQSDAPALLVAQAGEGPHEVDGIVGEAVDRTDEQVEWIPTVPTRTAPASRPGSVDPAGGGGPATLEVPGREPERRPPHPCRRVAHLGSAPQ